MVYLRLDQLVNYFRGKNIIFHSFIHHCRLKGLLIMLSVGLFNQFSEDHSAVLQPATQGFCLVFLLTLSPKVISLSGAWFSSKSYKFFYFLSTFHKSHLVVFVSFFISVLLLFRYVILDVMNYF